MTSRLVIITISQDVACLSTLRSRGDTHLLGKALVMDGKRGRSLIDGFL